MRYFYLFLFCLLYRIEFIQAQNLYFGYDDSGNQVLRKLEYDEVRDPISRLLQPESIDPSAVGEPIMYTKNNEIEIYPNPVETALTIRWNPVIANLLIKIELLAYNATLIEEVKFKASERKAVLNMGPKPSGVYYVKLYCSDGRIIHHTVIKK
ncbi:Por secretion system C-terminal sorting domain-containing protein [Apibacter mensalis]|uniref:Por secretion system C-terminal sorting domain-containing protein n=1 Tax=Apibacter mensalis TaxID=1586267 RepID=A0A0X3APC5_9FLAO|nr:T9SS type A sorting domain-containing protein [Apibacter mensalis]CVK16211.1 Por secretion system C-terminal sorting domain-containing protein [Apibacter mensalis]